MKKFILCFCLILCLAGCGNRKNANEIIDDAERCVSVNPDSALKILSEIKEPQNLTDSIKAKYWLTIGQAHSNKDVSMYRDSLLAYSLQYYNNEHPDNYKYRIKAHYLYSKYLYLQNKKQEAINLLKSALANSNDVDSKKMLLNALVEFSGTDGTGNFSDQIKYLHQLIAIDDNTENMLRYQNALAMGYYYLNDRNNVYRIYDNISHYIKTPQDSIFAWDVVWVNYADFSADFGDYEKAIELQNKVLEHYRTTGNPMVMFPYISLAWYYLNIGQTDKAQFYLELAEKNKIDIRGEGEGFDVDLIISIEKFLIDYKRSGRFSLGKAALFTNQVNTKYLHSQWIKYAQQYDMMLLEQKNMELIISKQRQRIILFVLIASIGAIAISVYLFIKRRQKQIEEKEEEIEALKSLAIESESSDNHKDDRFFKKIMMQQLGVIKMLSENPSSANQEILHRMTEIADHEITVDTLLNWDDLYKTIDFIYNGYYTGIVSKYGEVLNEREIQLCCLLKANFLTKEISVVTQQSVRTIYQRNTVIRQKLHLEEKADIADFLSTTKI